MQKLNVIHLRCCEHESAFEIEYEIGTTYLVCQHCSELKHFARGINSKKDIDNSLTTETTSENSSNHGKFSK